MEKGMKGSERREVGKRRASRESNMEGRYRSFSRGDTLREKYCQDR